jgi:hypothetical protein
MSTRVFFDIDIGDSDVHARELAKFETTVGFFEQNRAQLGLPDDAALDSLDGDGQELLVEAFRSRNASVSSTIQLTFADATIVCRTLADCQHGACAGG